MAEEALNAVLVRGFAEFWWPGVDDVVAFDWADCLTGPDDCDDKSLRPLVNHVDYTDGFLIRFAR